MENTLLRALNMINFTFLHQLQKRNHTAPLCTRIVGSRETYAPNGLCNAPWLALLLCLFVATGCAAEVTSPEPACDCAALFVSLDTAAELCPKDVPTTTCADGTWTLTCDGSVTHLRIVSDGGTCNALELVP